ncbi:gluconate 2-dehydrogenase subunit 3 family protein [Parasulfuritortus cantonensis]|uniref:Gluconate 2-dehydrogenase subunit 3 family protein n=1 Tax=Parasulfuritortus cantonensis TaxID=2528202 RepID=A0A4R1B404_9PROT|nr:gluconate 2-dehydrogenase subunit 3 family protein [Parasulfuritortus cantonensis]TCJ12812.1 gluconate 2-dehydrogenase subunit 3 family protein [Parasulfuritortus cantonensis]
MREDGRRLAEADGARSRLAAWRVQLLDRRRFLLRLAGGSLAALFPLAGTAAPTLDAAARWRIVDAVQRHLFPSEPDAPGAAEIKALAYLRFMLGHDPDKADDGRFILQGAGWLDDMAQRLEQAPFGRLDEAGRERVLRAVEKSEAGANWLALLLLYVIEALLADPVYGGNPDGVGWRWLAHVPGYPHPPPGKRYMELRRR